jgi:hypothetical protein
MTNSSANYILMPRNDWALVGEEGFVELPPTDPDSRDPPFQYEDLVPVIDSYVPWQFNSTSLHESNDTVGETVNLIIMEVSSSEDDLEPAAQIIPVVLRCGLDCWP